MKMAGALETAHRARILHRDVKPANILLTDYGEPALSDFGIAHIAGGFKTATGIFTGSPAFTAPRSSAVIRPARPPTCTGWAPRCSARSPVMPRSSAAAASRWSTQFLRIASESAPDLRESGIPDDVAAVVERAMSRDPHDRPPAADAGRRTTAGRKRDTASPSTRWRRRAENASRSTTHGNAAPPVPAAGSSNLPLELTSFVGRRRELAEVKHLLATSRLVTLTGIGGVGKTRLALRVAAEVAARFPDGVWLVELGRAARRVGAGRHGRGERCRAARRSSARPSDEVLVDFLCTAATAAGARQLRARGRRGGAARRDAAAGLPGPADPGHQPRAARHRRGSGAALSAAAGPGAAPEPTLARAARIDAVALFAERAAAALPGFALTDDNAARSPRSATGWTGCRWRSSWRRRGCGRCRPKQILQRLADRFTLLTRGSRGAPTRQQTLGWSIGWSYDLCTPAEQQLWGRLSVFAGSFELEAAEEICGDRPGAGRFPRSGVVAGGQVDPAAKRRTRCGPAPVARDRPRLRKGADSSKPASTCNSGGDTVLGIASWRTTP